MKLSDKIRYLREVEGNLRGLDRAMTQQELVRAIQESNRIPQPARRRQSDDQPVLPLADRERRSATSHQHHAASSREVFQGSPWLSGRRSRGLQRPTDGRPRITSRTSSTSGLSAVQSGFAATPSFVRRSSRWRRTKTPAAACCFWKRCSRRPHSQIACFEVLRPETVKRVSRRLAGSTQTQHHE